MATPYSRTLLSHRKYHLPEGLLSIDSFCDFLFLWARGRGGRGLFWHPESLTDNGVWTCECCLCLFLGKQINLPTVNERSDYCAYQDSASEEETNPNQNSTIKNRSTDSLSQSPEGHGVHIRDPGTVAMPAGVSVCVCVPLTLSHLWFSLSAASSLTACDRLFFEGR